MGILRAEAGLEGAGDTEKGRNFEKSHSQFVINNKHYLLSSHCVPDSLSPRNVLINQFNTEMGTSTTPPHTHTLQINRFREVTFAVGHTAGLGCGWEL